MTKNKIYGTYTGLLSKDGIDVVTNGTELELYSIINSINKMIWKLSCSSSYGKIQYTEKMRKNLIEAQYSIEFAILHTKRFGVDIPDPKENEHVERTDAYTKWFTWWNDYIQYHLSNEDYKRLKTLIDTKQDYSEFRPKGTWNL